MLINPVASLSGIGKTRASAFEKLGVYTVHDLLFFLPRTYQDFSSCSSICDLRHGDEVALRLNSAADPKLYYPSRGLSLVTLTASDATGKIQLAWFNQPYRKNIQVKNRERVFCGRVDATRGLKLINAAVMDELPGILPVYNLSSGLTQKHVRDAMKRAFSLAIDEVTDDLPERFYSEYDLMPIKEALFNIHFPENMELAAKARRRFSFEDMLYYLLAIAILKRERAKSSGIAFECKPARKAFLDRLPFALTRAQERVVNEIEQDMQKNTPMNRLIQGDVGSGKTILAFFAMRIACENGYQAVLMAPTELVARQHYALLEAQYGDKALLLFGGMTKKQKDEAYGRVKDGSAHYIVGTHALLQPSLVFNKLGLVITDEQHRFGVRQRAQIANKADIAPDILIMSATPIPRTLAMLLFGDLDISIVDELPPGRRPVITRLVPENRRMDMYRFIAGMVAEGRQAYIVCPLVEQSDTLDARSSEAVYTELIKEFPDMRFSLLHGRMTSAKKEEITDAFRRGETQILVSTTVIEVGVDIKNATIMAIENADRFGLAQLHQLRGRVGRGSEQSFCFLLGGESECSLNRMQIMTKTNDGFEIARKDLEIRGPGEFMGTKQHGNESIFAARVASNMDVLLLAQLAADKLINEGESVETGRVFARAKGIYKTRMREIANN